MIAGAQPTSYFRQHPALAFILLATPLAFWYSLSTLSDLAISSTPLAFVICVPFLAGYLLIHRGGSLRPNRESSDPFLDVLIGGGLLVVSAYLIFVLPFQLSWYYWLARIDLLAFPLVVTALVILFWGFGSLATLWPALVYAALIWTYPLTLFQQFVGPLLTTLSAGFGASVVGVFALPFTVAQNDPLRFVSTGPNAFSIIISSVCSGQDALLGFILIGTPLLVAWTGSFTAKLSWLLTGAIVAWLSNLFRIALLLILASRYGESFTIGTVHPVLGTVLFVLAFVGMLFLTSSFEIQTHVPGPPSSAPIGAPVQVSRLSYALAVSAIVVLAIGQLGLRSFSSLNAEMRPAVPVNTVLAVLPDLPGWTRTNVNPINWQDLFGMGSVAHVFAYEAKPASIVVQLVATPNRNLLDSYSPLNCDLFHGESIVGVTTADLGYGVNAQLIESRAGVLNEGTLYWFMPLLVDNQIQHVRVALLADTQMLPMTPAKPAS
ncbi:MAG TPA: archaeosortase/exosortase family protein, partial [Chloroflexota bacterium]|nr:archaeosortase/exosortase family protein [Chloroflexota bacterium]